VEQLDSAVEKFQKCIEAFECLGIDLEEDVKHYEQCWIQAKVDYASWTSKIPTRTETRSKVIINV